ncbi:MULTISPECIES: hypothetical protein [unclassified Streptococcus]|uniref:hypothetical protein n=1 Tax=unclassified Streptococcus TaxID=2608887 RepID=UPI001072AEFC|nr:MULTISPECIES: hypothetical protein [unclassified Streptococcus]MBF0806701.1 hypothetical protein [Streptococcus sp. 19428wA2_WM07]TFU26477.1 hypothetical protein E4T71_07915 [Streptococcus sp. WM07]
MEFTEVFEEIQKTVRDKMDIKLTMDDYDSFIVKKLAESNCITKGISSKQSHIAITGKQMDLFPYLYSKSFVEESESSMKNFFVFKAPISIYQKNCNYLDPNHSINFRGESKLIEEICVYSRSGGEQVQLSIIKNGDSENFISFRHLIVPNTFWIVLKRKNELSYDSIAVKENDAKSLKSFNNKIFTNRSGKPSEITFVSTDAIVTQNEKFEIDDNNNIHKFDVDCILRKNLIQEIRFGAPGTGKSYSIKNIIRESYPNYEESDSNPFVLRTTVHGEYSHFDFVGNIMPTSQEGNVSYNFTEGIFTTALIRAMLNKENDVYLIIEEMSRGDIASIFGDIFQLLDRNDQGISEYRIDNSLISDELIKYGAKSKGDDKIYLPNNLHIIGTVNTSDQNVNVLDTAFKRRFSFVYESVKPCYDEVSGAILNSATFSLALDQFEWNQFYLAINQFIVSDLGLSEDKQLGQFFVKFNNDVDVNETIKNKVLHYLWEDVQSASLSDEVSIFNSNIRAFSTLYDKFDVTTEASEIFSKAFLETYSSQKVELSKQQNE